MTKKPRDIGASVRARLLNLSRGRAQPFDLLLTRYALERLLCRLSVSAHRDRFVLKGALLVTTWFDNPHKALASARAAAQTLGRVLAASGIDPNEKFFELNVPSD